MNNNLNKKEQKNEDDSVRSVRPLMLGDFIGQGKIKKNLKVFVDANKNRGDVMDHILFYGPPGLGKTTLSSIIANEMGSNFRSTSGPVLTKAGDLAAILTNLADGDILFIDEIHRLNIAVEEILYSAMEDFKIDIIIGEGVSAKTVKIDIAKFTLVGATTRFGLLSNPLRTRFGIPFHLEFYSHDELKQVVTRLAKVLNCEIEEKAAMEIAMRSRGTPRIAIRLFKRVRDFAQRDDSTAKITHDIAKYSLNELGVDSLGLDENDLRYIRYIVENYSTRPVGIETIAAGLSEERDSIEDIIEPFLLQIGFLARTPRGRVLTNKAFNHIGYKIEDTEQVNQEGLFS